jgi:internalin A
MRCAAADALRLFYSYAHPDEHLRDELEIHLKLLERQGLIQNWHDRRIFAGSEWEDDIDDNLERADIILLLVSAYFIASDYCYKKEMAYALEKAEKNEAVVIPIILQPCNWKAAPFAKLGVLPTDGKAVTLWDNSHSAWLEVETGIRQVVEERGPRRF